MVTALTEHQRLLSRKSVPFAVKVGYEDAIREINRMRGLLELIDQRDAKWNLFNCPSGGFIRQEIKQILER